MIASRAPQPDLPRRYGDTAGPFTHGGRPIAFVEPPWEDRRGTRLPQGMRDWGPAQPGDVPELELRPDGRHARCGRRRQGGPVVCEVD